MLAGGCVIASILLIIGVCVESKRLMLPWLVAVPVTTLYDAFVLFFLMRREDLVSPPRNVLSCLSSPVSLVLTIASLLSCLSLLSEQRAVLPAWNCPPFASLCLH